MTFTCSGVIAVVLNQYAHDLRSAHRSLVSSVGGSNSSGRANETSQAEACRIPPLDGGAPPRTLSWPEGECLEIEERNGLILFEARIVAGNANCMTHADSPISSLLLSIQPSRLTWCRFVE
jgi:hypothetical protein